MDEPHQFIEFQANVFDRHGHIAATNWLDMDVFASVFPVMYERFTPDRFEIRVTERTTIRRALTPSTLYSILWHDRMGRHWDEIQKAVNGDDEGIPDIGVMDDCNG